MDREKYNDLCSQSSAADFWPNAVATEIGRREFQDMNHSLTCERSQGIANHIRSVYLTLATKNLSKALKSPPFVKWRRFGQTQKTITPPANECLASLKLTGTSEQNDNNIWT